jgi:hypothetical protein
MPCFSNRGWHWVAKSVSNAVSRPSGSHSDRRARVVMSGHTPGGIATVWQRLRLTKLPQYTKRGILRSPRKVCVDPFRRQKGFISPRCYGEWMKRVTSRYIGVSTNPRREEMMHGYPAMYP